MASEIQRSATRKGTLYVMDEPTTGLHPADVDLLLAEVRRLVADGATAVIVEHDLRVIAQADHMIDVGPGAGAAGGRIMAQGTPAQVAQTGEQSATGRCLAQRAGLAS